MRLREIKFYSHQAPFRMPSYVIAHVFTCSGDGSMQQLLGSQLRTQESLDCE